MEASINDDVSQKQSHQRVHFQLWDTCKDALAHLSAPGSFAWRLFLGALTLFPAGGRSQLTQCKMKLQEEPRLGLVYPSLICDTMTTHWKQKPYFYIFLSVSTYHVKRKKCFFLMEAFKPIRDTVWAISVQTKTAHWIRFSAEEKHRALGRAFCNGSRVSFQCHWPGWDRWSDDCNRSSALQ